MLKKQNLKQFYTQVMTTHEVFKTVVEKNEELELLLSPHEKSVSYTLNLTNLDSTQIWIMTHFSNPKMSTIASDLMREMYEYEFQKTSSVPKHKKTSSATEEETDDTPSSYEILSEINLYEHTMNCIVSSIEICEYQPQTVKEIVIILAILHDFGKHRKIQKMFHDANVDHEKLSASYADRFLSQYGVRKDFQQLIVETLRNHHYKTRDKGKSKTLSETKPVENKESFFTELLNLADAKARETEKNTINGRHQ